MSDQAIGFKVIALDPNNPQGSIKDALLDIVTAQSTVAMQELLGAIDKDSYAKLEEDTFAFLNQRNPNVAQNVYLAASLAANMIASNPLGHPDPNALGVMVRLASFVRIVNELVERIQRDQAQAAATVPDGAVRN